MIKRVLKIAVFLLILLIPIIIFLLNNAIFLIITCFLLWAVLFLFVLTKFHYFDSFFRIARGLKYRLKTGNKSKKLTIGENVVLNYPECVKIGENVKIGHDVQFFPLTNYKNEIFTPLITIGNNVIIGDYNRIACMDRVVIGNNVVFAAYVHITDHSHEYRDVSAPIIEQGVFEKGPVQIGEGTWIGIRCSILSGVTIGEHCIIAAGSVVTHDIPSFSLAAGIPAKIIKKYDFTTNKWVKVKNKEN